MRRPMISAAEPVRLLVVTGLAAEARMAAGPGCRVIAGGGDRAGLSRRLDDEGGRPFAGVISFGVAGGLAPDLPVGAVVLATEIVLARPEEPASDEDDRRPPRPLSAGLIDRLTGTGLVVRHGTIVGVDAPAVTASAKRALHAATGASAVDMESHVAAAYAARRDLPFLAIRAISDGADDIVPPAAANAMRPDGSVDILGLIAALCRDPKQIPGLVATARNAGIAFRTLRRVRRLLGSGFGLHL